MKAKSSAVDFDWMKTLIPYDQQCGIRSFLSKAVPLKSTFVCVCVATHTICEPPAAECGPVLSQ